MSVPSLKRLLLTTMNLKVLHKTLSCHRDGACGTFNYGSKLWRYSFQRISYSVCASKPLGNSLTGKGVKMKQLDLLTSFITASNELSEVALSDLKKSVFLLGTDINEKNFDAVFIELCTQNNMFTAGKSFFQMLQNQNRLNLASIGKFLRLCFALRDSCSEEDKLLIKLLCCDLTEKYPVLDVGTYESIILGISVTDSWKESMNILQKAKEVGSPISRVYSAIAEAAFSNRDFELGWAILDELLQMNKEPDISVYKKWLCTNKDDNALNRLLSFISTHNIVITQELSDLIVDNYQRLKSSPASITKISSTGICNNCTKSLQPVDVTPEEFMLLKDSFLKPVLIGNDVYLKSKPGEIDAYLKFLTNAGRVDVVLDGLNIAYAAGIKKSSPKVHSKMLMDVVKYFVARNMRVMVIGRKHMVTWPKKNMDFIFKSSSTFLADNVSSDDPLLLFGAMYSGLGTIFVSRDLMKSHKFLIKESNIRQIFERWQQKHQYYLKHVDISGNVTFQEPLPYLQEAHYFNGVWHIPVNSGDQRGVLPQYRPQEQTWLCLQ